MMRNQSMWVWVCSMVMVLAMTSWVAAEIPQIIAYQGILSDAEGNTLDGSYDITARLYTAASGTTAIWTETHSGVGVAKGVFAIMLGRSSSLTTVNFDQHLWLGVSVNQGAEMAPGVEQASAGKPLFIQQ